MRNIIKYLMQQYDIRICNAEKKIILKFLNNRSMIIEVVLSDANIRG